MKSGGCELVPSTLSPMVKTVPEMVSRIAAVASSVVRSQRAMSPAPTSVTADPGVVLNSGLASSRGGGRGGPCWGSWVSRHVVDNAPTRRIAPAAWMREKYNGNRATAAASACCVRATISDNVLSGMMLGRGVDGRGRRL